MKRLFATGSLIKALGIASICLCSAHGQSLRYGRVSREVVEKRLESYKGDDRQREETLNQLFSEAGCDNAHLSEQAVKGVKQPNVICLLPGTSHQTIIVGAHFDHVSWGDGVVDNWSSASLLPSLYESMKGVPRSHSYLFIGFSGEEGGEIGSHFYVQSMTNAEVESTDAMVNLDTLGLGPPTIWGSHSDPRLVGALTFMGEQMHVPVSIVNVDKVGSSDSEQFASKKIPRITIHSLTQKTWDERIIHTSKDKLSAIRIDDYFQTYGLLAAYLTLLDQMPARAASAKPQ